MLVVYDRFFDTTPLGRILNRLSTDTFYLDTVRINYHFINFNFQKAGNKELHNYMRKFLYAYGVDIKGGKEVPPCADPELFLVGEGLKLRVKASISNYTFDRRLCP